MGLDAGATEPTGAPRRVRVHWHSKDAPRLAADRDPWERQPGESRQAFRAFSLFLAAEPPRTLPSVARAYAASLPLIKRWSQHWRWAEREEAWSRRVQQERTDAQLAVVRAEAAELERQRAALRQQEQTLAHGIFQRVAEMLTFPLVRQSTTEAGEDGQSLTTIVEPAGWRLRDVARLAQVASDLERRALGLESQRIALDLEGEARKLARERGLPEDEVVRLAVEHARGLGLQP